MRILFALLVALCVSSQASAGMIRSASGYSDPSVTDGQRYLGGAVAENLGSTVWRLTGIRVSLEETMSIDMISGIGSVVGNGSNSPTENRPMLGIYSSPEEFRLNNLRGDVMDVELDFSFMEEGFSAALPDSSFDENDYLELTPRHEVVLPAGDYVLVPRFEGDSEWFWSQSTLDLGSDLWVTSQDSEIYETDTFTTTGTIAVDVQASAIPEPSTIVGLGILLSLLGLRRLR